MIATLEWPRRSLTTLGLDAGGESEARRGMAKIVQTDPRQACSLRKPAEQHRDALGMQRLAVLAREHVSALDPRRSPCEPLLELTASMRSQDHRNPLIEADLPTTRSRFSDPTRAPAN